MKSYVRNGQREECLSTEYRGTKFRSRLEARFAVFLWRVGIEYIYEPETFELAPGHSYTPDFFLVNVWSDWGGNFGVWVEVKPLVKHCQGYPDRLSEVAKQSGHTGYIWYGNFPELSWFYARQFYNSHDDDELALGLGECGAHGEFTHGSSFAGLALCHLGISTDHLPTYAGEPAKAELESAISWASRKKSF